MANTGYRQAAIAYKVTKPGGEPLDIDGVLTSISGKKQAVALLAGRFNPDPMRYEAEFYFSEKEAVTGNATLKYDPDVCPTGFINTSVSRIILDPQTQSAVFTLNSSSDWKVLDYPASVAEPDLTQGRAGSYDITVIGVSLGYGYLTFKNDRAQQTARIFMANVPGKPWVLDTGVWNGLGFWVDDGKWKYK